MVVTNATAAGTGIAARSQPASRRVKAGAASPPKANQKQSGWGHSYVVRGSKRACASVWNFVGCIAGERSADTGAGAGRASIDQRYHARYDHGHADQDAGKRLGFVVGH